MESKFHDILKKFKRDVDSFISSVTKAEISSQESLGTFSQKVSNFSKTVSIKIDGELSSLVVEGEDLAKAEKANKPKPSPKPKTPAVKKTADSSNSKPTVKIEAKAKGKIENDE